MKNSTVEKECLAIKLSIGITSVIARISFGSTDGPLHLIVVSSFEVKQCMSHTVVSHTLVSHTVVSHTVVSQTVKPYKITICHHPRKQNDNADALLMAPVIQFTIREERRSVENEKHKN